MALTTFAIGNILHEWWHPPGKRWREGKPLAKSMHRPEAICGLEPTVAYVGPTANATLKCHGCFGPKAQDD